MIYEGSTGTLARGVVVEEKLEAGSERRLFFCLFEFLPTRNTSLRSAPGGLNFVEQTVALAVLRVYIPSKGVKVNGSCVTHPQQRIRALC